MNKERLLRLAQAIESHELDLGFNMAWWNSKQATGEDNHPGLDRSGHGCGTSACIGGWAKSLWPMENPYEALELDYETTGSQLFYGGNQISNLDAVSSEQAVRVLRHAAETGVIDWSINL